MQDSTEYHWMLAGTRDAYDKWRQRYIPVMPAHGDWSTLVKTVIRLDSAKRQELGMRPEKDGYAIIPSKIEHHRHHKSGRAGYWRNNDHCTTTHLLCVDIEEHPIGDRQADVLGWLHDRLNPMQRMLVYTSWNHGVRPKWSPGHPRFRVIMPLARPVDSQTEYRHLWSWAETVFGHALDDGTGEPSRLSYTFRKPGNPDAVIDPWFIESGTAALNPDELPLPDGDTTSVTEIRDDYEQQQRERRQRRQQRLEQLHKGVLENPDRDGQIAYLKGTLRNICDEIRSADQGERHHSISKGAWKIGTMLQGVDVEIIPVREALIAAGKQALPPRRHREVTRTVGDQIKYGMTQSDPFDWSRIASVSDNTRVQVKWGDDGRIEDLAFESTACTEGGGRHE